MTLFPDKKFLEISNGPRIATNRPPGCGTVIRGDKGACPLA